jgi:hypothetical protein
MMNGHAGASRWLLVLAGLAVAALGLVGVQLYRLEAGIRGQAEQLAALERVMQLYRFERNSTAGLGASALLEQLRFWAPKLESAATPQAEQPAIRKRVDDVLAAFMAAGSDTGAILEAEFHRTKSGADDELRKWIVRGLVRADRERAKTLLVQVLRGLKFDVSPRLREFAADELIAIDKATAGQVLRDILGYESKGGLVPERMPRELIEQQPHIVEGHRGSYPGFFNFVIKYAQTGDPETVPTLLMLIGRAEHDRMTIQECVKHLGALKARDAVPRIQELFDNPPEIPDNPMFKNICLDALVAIQGREACNWLRQAQVRETRELVANKLRDLLQQHCR